MFSLCCVERAKMSLRYVAHGRYHTENIHSVKGFCRDQGLLPPARLKILHQTGWWGKPSPIILLERVEDILGESYAHLYNSYQKKEQFPGAKRWKGGDV